MASTVTELLRRRFGGKKGLLPSGYTQLEYLQNDSTAYINTNYVPTVKPKIWVKAMPSKTGDKDLAGFSVTKSPSAFILDVTVYFGRTDFYFKYGSLTTGGTSSSVAVLNNICTFEMSDNGGFLNDVKIWDFSGTYDFSSNTNVVYLYKGRNTTSYVRIYGAKLWDNDVLVRDFVPCINPNNEYGMYDLVEGVFYGNAASDGSFTGA